MHHRRMISQNNFSNTLVIADRFYYTICCLLDNSRSSINGGSMKSNSGNIQPGSTIKFGNINEKDE